MTFDVALSYAQEDAAIAHELSSRLQRAGLEAFDYRARPEQLAGRSLDPSLDAVYATSRCVLILFSVDWRTEHTERELAAAQSGAAAVDNLWIVRLDQTELTSELTGRVWWDFAGGLPGLVRALCSRLEHPAPSRRSEVVAGLVLTTAFGAAALVLGFTSLERSPDRLAWAGVLAPTLWTLAFRVLPDLRQRRARQKFGLMGVETPVERLADRSSRIVAAALLASSVVLCAVSLQGRQAALAFRNDLIEARSSTMSEYPKLRAQLNRTSTDAARVASDPTASHLNGYDASRVELLEAIGRFRALLLEAPPAVAEHAANTSNSLTTIERTVTTHFAAQITVLRDSNASSSRRRIATSSLLRYNTFLATTMNEFELLVRDHEAALESEIARAQWQWEDYVSERKT